jgi:hypothetical protein
MYHLGRNRDIQGNRLETKSRKCISYSHCNGEILPPTMHNSGRWNVLFSSIILRICNGKIYGNGCYSGAEMKNGRITGVRLNYPFAVEMPWDSTGQEECIYGNPTSVMPTRRCYPPMRSSPICLHCPMGLQRQCPQVLGFVYGGKLQELNASYRPLWFGIECDTGTRCL